MTSTSIQERSIYLGASGWSNPAWLNTFYPVDMPEEWRLTFFNTQFNCVFLAHDVWQLATPEQRLQWVADTHEQFVFLLEADSLLSPPAEMSSKALCIEADDARIVWFSAKTALKDLAQTLSGSAQAEGRNWVIDSQLMIPQSTIQKSDNLLVRPRFLISQDGDFGQIERVTTLLEVLGL
jgi:hypothetical protein